MAAVWKRLQMLLGFYAPAIHFATARIVETRSSRELWAVEWRNGRIARLLATHFGVENRQFLHHKPSPSTDPWSIVVNELRYFPDRVLSFATANTKNEILRGRQFDASHVARLMERGLVRTTLSRVYTVARSTRRVCSPVSSGVNVCHESPSDASIDRGTFRWPSVSLAPGDCRCGS